MDLNFFGMAVILDKKSQNEIYDPLHFCHFFLKKKLSTPFQVLFIKPVLDQITNHVPVSKIGSNLSEIFGSNLPEICSRYYIIL